MNHLQTRHPRQWTRAQGRMHKSKLVNRVTSSKLLPHGRAAALGVAFGESLFLRKLFLPILVPLKLWLSLEIVLLTKAK